VGLTGGWVNASTAALTTVYKLSAPNHRIAELLDGFYSRVFEPVFTDEMLANQRQVVANERLRAERWYPGGSEIGWYEQTQWQDDMRFSLRQALGMDEDLAQLDDQRLRAAHAEYTQGAIRVVVVGPADVKPLIDRLGKLQLSPTEGDTEIRPLKWVNQQFHIKHFRDASRPVLALGGFMEPAPDIQLVRQLRFILNYLTNATHGALFSWLRYELGWSYGVGSSTNRDKLTFAWDLRLPVHSLAQIEVVRREWRDRALAALTNQESVNLEVDRMLGASTYWDVDPDETMASALHDLDCYDRIVSNNEWRSLIEGCRDQAVLQRLFDRYFAPEAMGSYCVAPEVD
jgi:predicted Zn-dependent peptidase